MDLTSLFGQGPATSWLSNQPFGALALPGAPANAGNNAPMNILPSVAQTSPDATPVNVPQPGILNNSGNDAATAMAMKMIQPQHQQVAPLQPINYAKLNTSGEALSKAPPLQHTLQARSFNDPRQSIIQHALQGRA
jgi:hypothetical protein